MEWKPPLHRACGCDFEESRGHFPVQILLNRVSFALISKSFGARGRSYDSYSTNLYTNAVSRR